MTIPSDAISLHDTLVEELRTSSCTGDETVSEPPPSTCEQTDSVPLNDDTSLHAALAEELQRLYLLAGESFQPPQPENRAHLDPAHLSNALKECLHAANLSALCLSGGGIRSASFALGIIQSLAKFKRLHSFDYLSTVSGGGYTGAWLSAWCTQYDRGIVDVETELAGNSEPQPVTTLRQFTSYLTPERGLFSLDTASAGAIVIRNLILNWLIFLPVFALIALIPKLTYAFYQWNTGNGSGTSNVWTWLLLGSSGVLYAISQIYTAWQLSNQAILGALAERRDQIHRATYLIRLRYDLQKAGWLHILILILLPTYVAGCLGITALVRLMATGAPLTEPSVLWPWFLSIGGVLWGLPFLSVLIFRYVEYQHQKKKLGIIAAADAPFEALRQISRLLVIVFARACGGLVLGAILADALPLLLSLSTDGRSFPSSADAISFGEWTSRSWNALCHDPRLVVVFGANLWLMGQFLADTAFVAISSPLHNHDALREWLARLNAGFLLPGLMWLVVSLLVLWDPLPTGVETRMVGEWAESTFTAIGGLAGVGAALFGAVAPIAPKTDSNSKGVMARFPWARLAAIGAILFFAVLLMTVSRAVDQFLPSLAPLAADVATRIAPYTDGNSAGAFSAIQYGMALLIVGLILFITSWAINVNKFSLHAFYRNRLIRAYLGASKKQGRHITDQDERQPNRFTGFDEWDNIAMCQLGQRVPKSENAPETSTKRSPLPGPLHIINMALNLVHGERLAWQDRKASSFTVSQFKAGSPEVGYRRTGPSVRMEPNPQASIDRRESNAPRRLLPQFTKDRGYGDGISLGTATAISGAALSPSMGYHSQPTVSFLMTLFNVRLGWWLGNPKKKAWQKAGPFFSIGPILEELLGLTNARSRYVYLSDGGHFENLGIYEMLRRQCRTIIAVDAGCDSGSTFVDLGNAVAKARIDLGIEITFRPRPLASQTAKGRLGLVNDIKAGNTLPYCAIADIKYPMENDSSQDGVLIYLKPALHGTEPEDVLSYAADNDAFPHETTMNQFFTERQFESYRRLGQHIGDAVFKSAGEANGFAVGRSDRARRAQDLIEAAERHCAQYPQSSSGRAQVDMAPSKPANESGDPGPKKATS
ncbi:hypothetical protein [Nitrospirillum sp. BR 11163]|uniref:hypothetical protein n=1 Tax=Nitrospirillum sp. BR 11163 TaxID=3104323 RepID=UPI002AFDD793|nr:hypothetical protein [Nitrospirillum sp. BR 11163]MEA1675869.1 hypothetical protein [Nitrospirillum sp. BR 11163]